MGVTRKITYASVAKHGYTQTVYSDAETWGQLKKAFPEIESFSHGMTSWVKTDRSQGEAFSSDHQQLPLEDITILFLLEKNKSGNEVLQAVEEWFVINKERIKLQPGSSDEHPF